ncbi:MAG: hypothetical protein ACM3L6_07930 [Deltaproteobacteria bacterium]
MKMRAATILGIVIAALLFSFLSGAFMAAYVGRGALWPVLKAQFEEYRRHYTARRFADDDTYRDDDDMAPLVRVFVDPETRVARVSPRLFGADLSSATETRRDVAGLVRRSGIAFLRFPGGRDAAYHWQAGTFDATDRFDRVPLRDFDNVVRFCRSMGTKPVIRVDVASSSPREAADWVAYLNKTVVFPAKYWELSDGACGPAGDACMAPEEYARRIVAFAAAMRQADPDIRIGMDWRPEAGHSYNARVVRKAGEKVDFVGVCWRPDMTGPDKPWNSRIHPLPLEVMANAGRIPGLMKEIREVFEKHGSRRGPIETAFFGWDGAADAPASDAPPHSRGIAQWSLADALFTLDCLGTFAENEVMLSAPCELQATAGGFIPGEDRDVAGGGRSWDGVTVRPKALAMELFAEHFGDVVVTSTVADFPFYYAKDDWRPGTYRGKVPYVTAYAGIFEGRETLSLLLINKHPVKTYSIRVSMFNASVKPRGTVYMLTGPALDAQNDGAPGSVALNEYDVRNIGREMDFTLAAHSAMLIQMDTSHEE